MSTSTRSILRVADDAIFRVEQAMISVFLIGMTAMVFIDVVYRRLAAPDSRIGRLIASFMDLAPESAERAFIDAKVAPWVGAGVGLFLLWAGAVSAERNAGKRLLNTRFSAILLMLGSAVALVAFGALLLSVESYVFYLVLYSVSVGLYALHLVRKKPAGWIARMIAIVVLTPAFVALALHYFPEEYNWAKELAMLAVLWVGFFGASVCVHEGKHIRLEALERTWPTAAARWLRLASALLAASFCGLFAYLGYRYVFAANGTFTSDMRLVETGLPDWVMTVSIPLAFALTCARLIAAGVSAVLGGTYGAPAKAEGMEEAEQIAKERAAASRTGDEEAQEPSPEREKAASVPAEAPQKPRTIVFYIALALAVLVPLVLLASYGIPGLKAGCLFSAILVGAILGEPIFVILGIVVILCFSMWSEDVTSPHDLSIMIERIRGLADNKALLSVPFYVMSGAVMGFGQIGRRLVDFSNAFFGWLPGGLAISVVFGCILFAAISGSSPATVIAIGSVMGPALIAHGYDKSFSIGLVTASGSLGILIPPSIPMIVYCIVNTTTVMSVEEFHAAGIVPGFVIGGTLAVYCVYRGIKDKTPRDPFSLKRVWETTRDGIWSLLFPVLILGGIYLGFFDDIEAACTSVVYAVVIEVFVHRAFKLSDIPKVFMEVGVLLGSFLVVLVVAMSFAEFLETAGVPQRAAAAIHDMDLEAWQFLLAINVLLLIAGCFMDIMSAIFIFVPILAPMAAALGIDPVHLGIIFIVNLEIGYLSPPMGLNLFVSSTLFNQPITFIIRSVIPFIFVMIVGLGIVTYVPSITVGSAHWIMSIARGERPAHVERPSEPGDPSEPTEPDEPLLEGESTDRVMSLEEMMELSDDAADAGVPTP